LCLALVALSQPATAQERWVDPALDAEKIVAGAIQGGSGTDGQIIRYRNWASFSPTRAIHAGDYTVNLRIKTKDFSNFRYSVNHEDFSVDDFMVEAHVGGLLVLKNGEILMERYGLGNTEDSLWVSYSMAKSVTSMLMGAALKEGYIRSIDDKVTDYLPLLRGTSYADATLRNVLQMASGTQWNEVYTDPNNDVFNYPSGNVVELLQFLGNKERLAAPGENFNYNTGETDLVGAIVRAAIGNNLATYLEHKIWQPFGMENDANWATHGDGGGERGGCCINATLRDYGRLGLFAMNGGALADGTRVLPEDWMEQSTTPSEANDGYGYLWWLNGEGVFRASGIYGQGIYINPSNDLVIVVLSAWPAATGGSYSQHRGALFSAVDALLTD
jgi:CubicO group peptidase (beta-lactamase class C family)